MNCPYPGRNALSLAIVFRPRKALRSRGTFRLPAARHYVVLGSLTKIVSLKKSFSFLGLVRAFV